MATRAEVNLLAAQSLKTIVTKSTDDQSQTDYILSLVLRSIYHTAKQRGTLPIAKEAAKEIYTQVTGKDPTLGLCILGVYPVVAETVKATVQFNVTITPPSQYVDGSPLGMDEIAMYRIYYAVDSDVNESSDFFDTTNKDASFSLDLIPRATPYTVRAVARVMTVYNTQSDLSNVIQTKGTVVPDSPPEAPQIIEFKIICTHGCIILKNDIEDGM